MDPTGHTFIAETGLPGQRRRKVRLACNPCRARKTGCDGRKPVCTACSLRGWDDRCGWQDSVMPTSSALTLVELDRRLLRLESGVRNDSGPSRNVSPDDGSNPVRPESTGTSQSRQTENQDVSDSDDSEDAANAIQANSTFMRHAVNAAVPGPQNADPTYSPTAPDHVVPNMIGFSVETLDPSFGVFDRQSVVLPLQSFADELIQWYWQHVHSHFLILHRQLFEAEYSRLWTPTMPPSRGGRGFEELVFHATLNIVLALGCQRNESISLAQRAYQAEEFYRRSQRLISIETLDASSLSLVQLLLLRSLYLYFATRADRCWIMLGAAIRMAIGMGLNNPGSKKVIGGQLEREMRRRVWHCGCFTLDQIISTAFGRPTMIYKQINNAPLPLPIDDQYLSTAQEGRQPDNVPARVALSIYSLKAAEILEEMRAVIFTARLKASQAGPNSGDLIGPDPSALLRLHSRIEDYLGDAPAHLQPDADYSLMDITEDDRVCFQIQGRVLRSRMTLMKLMLLRPSVLAEVHRWASPNPPPVQSSSAKLEERLHKEVCVLCLSTVHVALEEMHRSLYSVNEFPAWHCLHVTFAAATVLVAAMLSPALGVDFNTEPTKSSWERAIQIMERHKSHIASAEKGIEVLQQFRMYITSKATTRQTGSPGRPGHIPPGATQITPFTSAPGAYSTVAQSKLGFDSSPSFNAPDYHHPQGQFAGTPQMFSEDDPGITMMEGLEGYLGSSSLDQAWLTTQDFGQNDWMLHWK